MLLLLERIGSVYVCVCVFMYLYVYVCASVLEFTTKFILSTTKYTQSTAFISSPKFHDVSFYYHHCVYIRLQELQSPTREHPCLQHTNGRSPAHGARVIHVRLCMCACVSARGCAMCKMSGQWTYQKRSSWFERASCNESFFAWRAWWNNKQYIPWIELWIGLKY